MQSCRKTKIGVRLPDMNTYLKATEIKIVCNWYTKSPKKTEQSLKQAQTYIGTLLMAKVAQQKSEKITVISENCFSSIGQKKGDFDPLTV